MPRKPKHTPAKWLESNRGNQTYWDSIESDFEDAKVFLINLSAIESFDLGDVVVGGTPDEADPKSRMTYAFNVAVNLEPEIEELINNRIVSIDSLWAWGEFQKAISLLVNTYPNLQTDRGIRAHNANENKDPQRQWYALWFEYWKDSISTGSKSRESFDDYFDGILHEIHSGKRRLNADMYYPNLASFINKFTEEPDDFEYFSMTANFRGRKFSGPEFEETLLTAKEFYYLLPPVGEENYEY